MPRKVICLILLLLLIAGSAAADRRVFVTAETTRYLEDGVILFEGGVEIRYEEMIINALEGEYLEEEEELTLEIDVVAVQDKNQVKSEKMWMDLTEEYIIFSGGRVETLFYFEQEEGGEEMPVEMWSDTLEMWEQTGDILAKGDVEAFYDDMEMEADEVLIEEEKDLLTATGNVYVLRDDGSWFRAEKVEYNLEDGTIVAYKMESEFELRGSP